MDPAEFALRLAQQALRDFFSARVKDWHSLCVSVPRANKMLEPGCKTSFSLRRPEMKTLIIKDLSLTEQLDSKAMRAVRGGYVFPTSNYFNFSPITIDASKHVNADQSIATLMNVQVETGNGSAFLDHVTSNVNPTVYASNTVNVK
jgi:hypothetical protein